MTDQTPNNGLPPAEGQPPVPPANPDQAPQPSQPHQMEPQTYGEPPQQYGQQPNSYDAGPGGSVHPGGPAGPGGPVPPKKGLPGWAIGLIIAGGLLLIGIIVAMVMVVSLIVNSAQEGQSLPPTASEEPPAETETEEPPAGADTDPGDSGSTSGNISLDDSATFDAPPIWAAPLLDGWDIVIFDQDGINQFENTALDCNIVTSQNVSAVDTSSSGDSASTMELMEALRDELATAATTVDVVSERPVDLSVGAAGSGSSIEFMMNRMNYSIGAGDYGSVLFGRSMPHSGSYMWSHLSCERSVLDGADSPLQTVIDQIAVMPAF